MNPILQCVLLAYRPLYLHGLLMDGQYRLPTVSTADRTTVGPGSDRSQRRALIAALVAAVGAASASMRPAPDPSSRELA